MGPGYSEQNDPHRHSRARGSEWSNQSFTPLRQAVAKFQKRL